VTRYAVPRRPVIGRRRPGRQRPLLAPIILADPGQATARRRVPSSPTSSLVASTAEGRVAFLRRASGAHAAARFFFCARRPRHDSSLPGPCCWSSSPACVRPVSLSPSSARRGTRSDTGRSRCGVRCGSPFRPLFSRISRKPRWRAVLPPRQHRWRPWASPCTARPHQLPAVAPAERFLLRLRAGDPAAFVVRRRLVWSRRRR
jgi:hypothetical protein